MRLQRSPSSEFFAAWTYTAEITKVYLENALIPFGKLKQN